jgi:hypothetical protein
MQRLEEAREETESHRRKETLKAYLAAIPESWP